MSTSVALAPQRVYGVVAKNSPHFIETIFDAFEEGAPVVFLRGISDERITRSGVTDVVEPRQNFGWFKPKAVVQKPSVQAQIAFTSGTEGASKGVLLTHGNLADTVSRLNQVMELTSEVREYIGVPLHYSFGMGRCRAVGAVGGQCFVPQHGFNPIEIRDLLRQGEINAVSAVPSLWRVLLQGQQIFGDEARLLRWIEIGSQPMSRAEKEALKSLFPQAIIVQHYGLTEASRSTFLRIDQASGAELDSVGKPIGATEIRIAADGRIQVRGPHVAQQLLIGDEIVPNVDDSGWLRTNDLGRMDNGFLYFEGRADDVINCGGIKLSPDAIEERLRERLGVRTGVAVAPVPHALVGHAVLTAVLNETGLKRAQVIEALTAVLGESGIRNRSAVLCCFLDSFPVTATGKVQRKVLVAQYGATIQADTAGDDGPMADMSAAGQSAAPASAASMSAQEALVAEVWREVLDLSEVNPEHSFYDLGGDSLTALSAVMAMERRKVPSVVSKGMLQGLTVRQTAALMAAPAAQKPLAHSLPNDELRSAMAINMVRGFLVLMVIFAHWAPGAIERLPTGYLGLLDWLQPLFAIGTPGFAIVYGVSVGFSLFPSFVERPERFAAVQRRSRALLASGVVALALVSFAARWVNGEVRDVTDFANSFYTVISFYLLVTLTLPWWLRLLAKAANPAVTAGLLSVVLLASYHYLFRPLAELRATGFIELCKILVAAKYAYANLLGGTFGGVAIGLWFRTAVKSNQPKEPLVSLGLGTVLMGVLTATYAEEDWFAAVQGAARLWQWWAYLGIVALCLFAAFSLLQSYGRFGRVQLVTVRALSTVGILAFPLYIGHSAVIPLKDILHGIAGIDAQWALLISMLAFAACMGLLYRRIYETSFQ